MFWNKREAAQKAKDAHRSNIQKSLEHRLKIAQEKGDEALIKQLEAELKYFS